MLTEKAKVLINQESLQEWSQNKGLWRLLLKINLPMCLCSFLMQFYILGWTGNWIFTKCCTNEWASYMLSNSVSNIAKQHQVFCFCSDSMSNNTEFTRGITRFGFSTILCVRCCYVQLYVWKSQNVFDLLTCLSLSFSIFFTPFFIIKTISLYVPRNINYSPLDLTGILYRAAREGNPKKKKIIQRQGVSASET